MLHIWRFPKMGIYPLIHWRIGFSTHKPSILRIPHDLRNPHISEASPYCHFGGFPLWDGWALPCMSIDKTEHIRWNIKTDRTIWREKSTDITSGFSTIEQTKHNYESLYIHTYITLHYTTLHYITLHYTTLHYITLHYTTLHYITLHYITYLHAYMPTCPHVHMRACPHAHMKLTGFQSPNGSNPDFSRSCFLGPSQSL